MPPRAISPQKSSTAAAEAETPAPPDRYHTYLIFGAPGAGKGTQGKVLGNVPRFFHVACGDVFRSLDTRTKLGKAFFEYSSRGELVPDVLTIELWQEFIDSQVNADRFKPDLDSLVLDGIPRNVEQARLMENLINVRRVFHLSCPDRDELVRRLRKRALKDNRYDDASETVIRKRLATYEAETKPVLEYYGDDRVQTIDATQSPARVLWEILGAVTALGDGEDPTAHPLKAGNHNAAQPGPGRDHAARADLTAFAAGARDHAIPIQG
ncbi:MAG: nucleoside monophosphate kinase [Verrucomicrobia bacterium]|nr:nucleoside monophosphate kinase [Verrucomicrobiota bacterium]MBV9659042.1 nucleoside monophosphate kinase [Verrucomicrobiota bacterium]